MIAAVTSVLFAATLLPLPVPVVGATSHICLTPLFALIVGVRRVVCTDFYSSVASPIFCTRWVDDFGREHALSGFVRTVIHSVIVVFVSKDWV